VDRAVDSIRGSKQASASPESSIAMNQRRGQRLGRVAATEGDPERAGRFFGIADALFPASGVLIDGGFPTAGMLRHGSERPSFQRYVASARRRLDPREFENGWHRGKTMSVE
jgi:hypothetical protein